MADSELELRYCFLRSLRILSLSTNYPNPLQPDLGLFVRRRLQAIAKHHQITMVSPLPAFDYSHPQRKFLAGWKNIQHWQDESIQVWNPRWLYPPFGTPLNSVTLFLRIASQIQFWHQQQPFDLIDAHFGFPEGIAAAMLARKLNLPFTITQRGHEPIVAQRSWSQSRLSWALCSADHVISVSDELTRFAMDLGVSSSQATTVSNGVNSDIFYRSSALHVRTRLGIPYDARLILSVGYLVPRKGHQRVIHALKELYQMQSHTNTHLVIVGGESTSPGFARILQDEVSRSGLNQFVHFCPPLSQEGVAEMMNAADVLCLASDWEGCPNVVVEAMACGTPVVASGVGQNPQLIQVGVNGFLFPLKEPGKLAERLHAALQMKWDRSFIAEQGQRRTWDVVAEEVNGIFQQIVSQNQKTTF